MGLASSLVRLAVKAGEHAAEEAAAKEASLAVKTAKRSAPAIIGADPAKRVMEARAAELAVPMKKRLKPSGVNPAFKTGVDDYARTRGIVRQSTPEEVHARVPRPHDDKLPLGGRARPLIDLKEDIAQKLAEISSPFVGTNVQRFYHTGPIYEGLDDIGVDPHEFMRKSFAPSYAGTSPRTNTRQNLLNASMIEYLRGLGVPIDEATYATRGNIPGYPMMASHYRLSGDMLSGTHRPMINPKPSEFGHNVAGDLTGATADTHDIRGIIHALNLVDPGGVPSGWLEPGARARYAETGEFSPAKDVIDTLGSSTRNKVESQVEYGPVTDINQRAAEILGIPAADQQATQWFGLGDLTGLASEPKTIPELMNDRLDVTGQVLGMDPQEVLKLYGRGATPLMAKGGRVSLDDLSTKYDTQLEPSSEEAFHRFRAALPEDLRNDFDYDLRGAFKAGATANNRAHMTDQFKKPNHMTFSDGSQYSAPGREGGHWGDTGVANPAVPGETKQVFWASPYNLQQHSWGDLARYFDEAEPGNTPIMQSPYQLPPR